MQRSILPIDGNLLKNSMKEKPRSKRNFIARQLGPLPVGCIELLNLSVGGVKLAAKLNIEI
jgi:hypothetical protein